MNNIVFYFLQTPFQYVVLFFSGAALQYFEFYTLGDFTKPKLNLIRARSGRQISCTWPCSLSYQKCQTCMLTCPLQWSGNPITAWSTWCSKSSLSCLTKRLCTKRATVHETCKWHGMACSSTNFHPACQQCNCFMHKCCSTPALEAGICWPSVGILKIISEIPERYAKIFPTSILLLEL